MNAELSEADLTAASLIGADLSGATTVGADSTGTVWSETTCPDGTNSDLHGYTCVGYGS